MFPGSVNNGGTNFGRYTGGLTSVSTSGSTLQPIINVTGSGFLVAVYQYPTAGTVFAGRLQITIDGVVVANDTAFTNAFSSSNREANITFMFPFKRSLLVETQMVPSGTALTKVSYLLD